MKQSEKNELLSERELVSEIISGNEEATNYLFFSKCRKMLEYIIYRVFGNKKEYNELVSELYIYLQKDNWYKLRQFDYRSSLTTWLQVVAIRFFVKMRTNLHRQQSEQLDERCAGTYEQEKLFMLDLNRALSMVHNDKYREVIIMLVMLDKDPIEVAKNMGIKIENLYNIKSRALKSLIKQLV